MPLAFLRVGNQSRQLSIVMDISRVNSMDRSSFLEEFGNIFEHQPDAAEYCYNQRPFADKLEVVDCFSTYLDGQSSEDKLQILRNHPMLGSKGSMTSDSVKEQKAAALDDLTNSEAASLERLNQKYFAKFGFPFIICVAESSRENTMKSVEERINNDLAAEVLRGIDEVKKIAKHRILRKIN